MISAESSRSSSHEHHAPEAISLTFTPVLPRFLYSTIHSFEVVVHLSTYHYSAGANFRGLNPPAECVDRRLVIRPRGAEKGRGSHTRGKFRGGYSAGAIAMQFVKACAPCPRPRCSRRLALGSHGAKFADKRNIPRRHASYEGPRLRPRSRRRLYRNPPPLPRGERHAVSPGREGRALREAFCVNAAEAERVVELAREKGIFIMGGHVDQVLPLDGRGATLVAEGDKVKCDADVASLQGGSRPRSRLFDQRLAGEPCSTSGVYCISFASMVLGPAFGVVICPHLG